MKRILPVAMLLAIPLLIAPAQAYGQSAECGKVMIAIAADTGSAAEDCGAWVASDGLDLAHGTLCALDMVLLGKDLVDYSADCGPDGNSSPGGCAWWDLYCAAINVWNGPWGPGSWDFGGGGWWPQDWFDDYKPQEGPSEDAPSCLKQCSDQLTATNDLNGYIDCTARCRQNVTVLPTGR